MFFKKNQTINLGEFQDYSGFSVKSFSRNSKNALTEEARTKFKKKYDIVILGSLALYNGFSVDDLKEKKQPQVIIMSGLPCSGKSTYIKENLKVFDVVSFDDTILSNFGDNYNEAHKTYSELSIAEKRCIYLEIDILFRELLLEKKDIVIDFTNLSSELIDKWLSVVPADYRKICIRFNLPIETILERNKNRQNKFIPVDVLVDMEKNREEIEEEKFDTILYFT